MTNTVESETVTMSIIQNEFVDIDIGEEHIRFTHSGNKYHKGIVMTAATGREASLMFRASYLAEHPDFILPRFAGDLDRLKSFSLIKLGKQHLLRVQLSMQIKPERVISITLGPIMAEDVKRLIAALEALNIKLLLK